MTNKRGSVYFTQRVKVYWSRFTSRLRGFINSWKRTPHTNQDFIPSNIYRHCSELPLAAFINCSVDKDYRSLLKYGHAKTEYLHRAWDQIYSEYAEKSGSQTYKLLLNLSKDIGYLETKQYCIAVCLKVLQHRPDQKCIAILTRYGYKYAFDISNPKQYSDDIASMATHASSIQIQIQRKKKELIESTQKLNGKELTRDHFTQMMISIGKYMGQRIDPDKWTVLEFIFARQHYEKEIEAMQKVKLKNG